MLYIHPSAAQQYLIIQGFPSGCEDTNSASPFWQEMLSALVQAFSSAGMPFNSIACPKDLTEENAAVAAIVAQHTGSQTHPLADVTIISALVQSGHCHGNPCPTGSNDGSSYKASLLAGATHVWLEQGPPDLMVLLGPSSAGGFDHPEYNTSAIVLSPNNYDGGLRAGAEFCERAKVARPQSLALFYGSASAAHSTVRINGFKAHLAAHCNQHKVVFEGYADWSESKAQMMAASIFLRDTSITAVMAANDDMAIGAVKAANAVRPSGTSDLIIFGNDHTDNVKPYLVSDEILGTIDQLVSFPSDGLVYAVASVVTQLNAIKATASGILLSSKDIMTHFGLGGSAKIESSTVAYVSDMQQYVTRRLMQAYHSSSRPIEQQVTAPGSTAVNVSVGLYDVSITSFRPTAGTMEAVGWLTAQWRDRRLQWDPKLWPDTLRLSTTSLWAPTVYVQNAEAYRNIFEPPAMLFSDGRVLRSQQVKVSTSCKTVSNLRTYPFDVHECGIVLRVTSNNEQVMLRPLN